MVRPFFAGGAAAAELDDAPAAAEDMAAVAPLDEEELGLSPNWGPAVDGAGARREGWVGSGAGAMGWPDARLFRGFVDDGEEVESESPVGGCRLEEVSLVSWC